MTFKVLDLLFFILLSLVIHIVCHAFFTDKSSFLRNQKQQNLMDRTVLKDMKNAVLGKAALMVFVKRRVCGLRRIFFLTPRCGVLRCSGDCSRFRWRRRCELRRWN